MANKSRETANLVSSKTGIAVTLSGDPVILGVGNTELVRVTGGGFVGIGTTNPTTKLNVLASENRSFGISTAPNNATSSVFIQNTLGDAVLSLVNDDQASAGLGTFANNGSTIIFGGKYSSTFLTSNRSFGAVGAYKETNTSDNEQGYLSLYSRPSTGNLVERVRIKSTGNIGIGTIGSGYTLDIYGTSNNQNPTYGSLGLYGEDYAFIGFRNKAFTGVNNWFMGHVGSQSDATFTIRYGTGPGNNDGTLYLHKTNVVSVGSGVTTGTANQTFQVLNGGGYFSDHVSVGTTAKNQTLTVGGQIWLQSRNYITWNNGDSIIEGLDSITGYGTSITAYNTTMGRRVPLIITNGTNKSVGINTTYTSSAYGLYVQLESASTADSTAAIYAYGNVFCNTQYKGGFGSQTTGGTTDWNHVSNARSGNGVTLLLGTATNGPGGGNYYYPFSFEYAYKDGSGNMTQIAVPYYNAGNPGVFYHRIRYSGVWSAWGDFV